MPNFGTYYIDAVSFNDATTITDAAGIVAPDGVYQFDGVYREMVSGVLGPVIACESCCESCSATFVYPINATKNDYHKMCSNVGESTGTAIIVKFKFHENRFGYIQGLQASYDNSTHVGVVSNRYGWLEKKYVGNDVIFSLSGSAIQDIVNESPYSLTIYNWQSTQFIQTGQNPITESIALTDTNLLTTTGANIYNNPDECHLLIPKTSLVTTVDAEVYSPHRQIDSSGGACSVTVPCPSPLSRFSGTAMAASASAACSLASSSGLTNDYFLMRVNSTSGSPRLFDRVYLDSAGVTPLTTAGYYGIQNQYIGAIEVYSWIHVDEDGIVQAAGSCGELMLTEMISSEMRPTFQQACEYQNINGVNLPDQQYWHNGTGDAPQVGDDVYSDVLETTVLPDGWYQLMREYLRIEVSLGSVITVQNCT